MKISVQTMAVDTFVSMLSSLSQLLDKGAEHAKAKKIDPKTLTTASLAPDMFPLTRQVQIACDQAKNAIAQLTGQTPPVHEDNEQTFDELKARIEKAIAYIRSASASAFDGAEERAIRIPIPTAQIAIEMDGLQLLRDWALPHFYFHVVTAYDILRHNGVEIGKRDYLANVAKYIKPAS